MRIVFIGAVEFSRHCLEEVLRQGGHVVGVLNPEQRHAAMNSDYTDLAPVATKGGIPLYRFRRVKDPETVQIIRTLQPDIIFAFGLSQLIPKEILEVPTKGCIGVHPALLPRNRGRHPLIWALVQGLAESGLTFFYMDEGADSGDILWQESFHITLEDDAGSLYAKIEELASEAIREFLPDLHAGTASRRPQDHSLATYLRKRGEEEGCIDWCGPAMKAYNLIRALSHPYLGAHTFLGNQRMIVWKSRLCGCGESHLTGIPGEIVKETAGGVLVKCGEGALEILEWEGVRRAEFRVGVKLGTAQ